MSDLRHADAELTPDQFRAIGHQLVDEIAGFLGGLSSRPVAPDTTPQAMRALIQGGAPVPAKGTDPARLMEEAVRLLVENSTFNGHPRFFGYITSSAAPIGALADLLATTINANCGAWALSPIATEIERQSVAWIAELIGFPVDCGGILVSGGNMANMVCLSAALRARAGWDLRAKGVRGGAPLVVYASSEVHTWLQKGLDQSGLGTDAMRLIPVDRTLAMDVGALRKQIAADRAAGCEPAMVVGTAGTVSTGAVDPLPEVAQLCRDEGLWFHVDGAYGAPAAVRDDTPSALRAIGLADSVAVDPHKWLYAPLEAGCALVRDPNALHSAFSFHPPYFRFEGDSSDPPTNFHEWGPQNSRAFRALKVWLTIRQSGRDGYARMIGDDIALARELYEMAGTHAELEACTLGLSIATFRYVPPGLRATRDADADRYLDALNTELLATLQREGEVYVSNAVIDGRFALRACIVNFRTTSADIRRLVDAAVRAGRRIDAELRAAHVLPRPSGVSAPR